LFSYAEAAELIDRSPCRRVRLPQAPRLKRPSISPDDLDRLAHELGPDYAPMMWLAVVTGARWAECAGLTVGSLDTLHGTLTVAKQLARDRTLVSPKPAAGERTMTAPRWLLNELANLLARRGLTGADTTTLVFVNSFGRPLSYSPWRRSVWLPACERGGLAGLQFHDLRRANATALVAEGVDVKTAQARLGHASPTTTLAIYARASAEADRQASEKVGGLFRPRDARGMDNPGRRRKSE
jgi:integrase